MSERKPHIVIVSTWYPPVQGVAVNRIAAFAKYLDKTKYKISVISLYEREALEKEITNEVNIYRLKNDSLFQIPKFNKSVSRIHHLVKVAWKLFVIKINKEAYGSWTKNVINKLKEIEDSEKIDLIISSYPTIAAHEAVISFLSSNNCKIGWIADMRDEMSRNPFISSTKKDLLKKVEKRVALYANALITVSKPILEDFKKDFPNIKYFEEIRNGFDNDYLEKKESYKPSFNDTLTMLYAGTFYGKRKPNTFLSALSELSIDGLLPTKWTFRIIGAAHNFTIPSNIESHIEFIEHLPQQQCELEMFKADYNVFIHPDMGVKGVYSGKLFDYLSAGKPILAITDLKDVAAELIQKLNAGYIADFNDVNSIKHSIQSAIDNWKEKQIPNIDIEGVKKLHRKYQVEKLDSLINRILNESKFQK